MHPTDTTSPFGHKSPSALFEQRQDCAFVVSTHELFLPVENPCARVLMTRSCTWAGDKPEAWDLEILAQPAELPEELRLAVLGARSRVLFVEGASTSLDLPLYDTLFPELSVSACGNCVDVERAVRGLRATEKRHHVEAYGIVDRDDLDDAAVDKLAEAGIFALAVRSVESLYYCSDAMQAVARHQADSMGLDAENLVESAKRDALAALAPEVASSAESAERQQGEGRVRRGSHRHARCPMGQSEESVSDSTNVIDPLHSLAFSVQSNRGVYAILIGSGASRAAQIPTGWNVTIDLIRKLAVVRNETPEPDPASWFRDTFGTEPDYSGLLDQIAKTQPERQQLLRGYWEPTEEEREEGEKEPTAAHHAIAALASRGFIRIIVTTNFDKLMERALSAAGIEATILSTPDQIEGAPPLAHIEHLVLKVHGDYLDTRIRNTETELAAYPPEVDALLDRIFDEYGLIVCGWSGDWDPALGAALERAASRRYTTYWTTRRRPSAVAQRLIAHRKAEVIQIEDADTFFEKLKEDVTAIEEFSKPHPLSVDVAVTKLKRYMPEPRYRIQLSDLIEETVQEVIEKTSHDRFSPSDPNLDPETIARRMRAYEAACAKLTAMAMVGGAWAEREHYPAWHRALERLSSMRTIVGVATYEEWRGLDRYPGTLLLYALGLGAVDRNRLEFLQSLLSVKSRRDGVEEVPAIATLAPCVLLPRGGEKELQHLGRSKTPLNCWAEDWLREQARNAFPDEGRFVANFDKLEILLALGSPSTVTGVVGDWSPIGCFYWRGETRDRFLVELKQSLTEEQADSPYIRSGILGKTPEDGLTEIEELERRIEIAGWDPHFIHMRRRGA